MNATIPVLQNQIIIMEALLLLVNNFAMERALREMIDNTKNLINSLV